MFTVQRIYAYQPDSKQTAVFIDRLYPRGVHKEVALAERHYAQCKPTPLVSRKSD